MLTAGEFCNRHVVIGYADDHVVEIARRMREHHVGCVVIVADEARGRVPTGVITDRDIVLGLIAVEPTYLDRARVRDLATGKLVTVREDASLYDVVVRMRSHGIRRIPVVAANGTLVGIIAFDDVVGHMAEEMHRLASSLEREADKERAARPSL